MKTIFSSFLSLLALPALLSAQPTITNNEFYYVGDNFAMVDCNVSGLSAGGGGASQMWDFSALSGGGSNSLQVAANTSSMFGTANLLITIPGGLREYVQESSTDSYINGTLDTATGTTTEYLSYHISKRPFTYLTSYLDTYTVFVPVSSMLGTGYLTVTGDAYGTLKLPTGTYNNVLRIRKYQYEVDSASTSSAVYFTTTITYQWFDGVHSAPLLEIDSINGNATGSTETARYLGSALAIAGVDSKPDNFTGYLDNNELVLNGSFEQGKTYDVVMFNLIGNKVFGDEFIASGGFQRFDAGTQLAPGIYIVSIAQKNDEASREVIKVIKN